MVENMGLALGWWTGGDWLWIMWIHLLLTLGYYMYTILGMHWSVALYMFLSTWLLLTELLKCKWN